MKTLVLGLGNPILSDDSVGLRVAEELKDRLEGQEVAVESTSLAGLDLLDLLAGYDWAIIVDAIKTEGGRLGQIYRFEPKAFRATMHAASPHDVNLATALELGKALGLPLPQLDILAIEVADTESFGYECTPEVAEAIPVCVEMVLRMLNGNGII